MRSTLSNHLKLMLLLIALGCLENSAVAQQPELANPQNDTPWDTQTTWPFHSEMGCHEGAGIGSVFHGPQGSALGYRRGYRSFSDLLPTKNARPPRTDNQETQWQQLERALAPATAEQRANITIKTTKLFRYIGFNNLPDFSLDILPPIANLGAAKSQAYTVRMTLTPEYRDSPAGLLRTSNNSVTTASSAPCPESETKETKPLLKYEYIDKLGDLDDYNGRFGVTPNTVHFRDNLLTRI